MGTTDHIYIFRFVFEDKKKVKGFLVTLFLFPIMKYKNEKRKDGIYTGRLTTGLLYAGPLFGNQV